ncbi:methyltransferase [Gordonia spumicola]|uniref:Methyltransferase n=1 Tax=Gordonia spumicola TaxID=589161 RepID=A0A7I9VA96_9ACTN|nr:methyltransferase [Gordonia spumicola]GEE02235.1 methyltransferase [Gordonia spumicola]
MTAYPLSDPDLVDALGAALRGADFTSEGIDALLGERASAALVNGSWWPALRATRRDDADPALATLVRLFLLGSTEPAGDVDAALGSLTVDDLVRGGVVAADADGVRALLDIRPHGSDSADYLVVADQDASMRPGAVAHDHVLGIGGASMSLAQTVIRTPVRRALDLGTGCGVQALHMDGHCDEIVATDTNPRALALAAATARLNGMDWDLRDGSLYQPVTGETFDLIVSNPPFVVGSGAQDYIYRDSGIVGDGVSRQLIERAGDHLNPGGIAQMLANWMVYDVEDWDSRIRAWVETSGLDAWVVQRELADPISYVSLWVSDAGESTEDAARRGAEWLDWFEREGIVGIGMGSVTLRKPVDDRPADVTIEEITAAGQEVTGFEAQAWWRRRDFLRTTSDAELLAARLTTPPVFLETQSLPGDEGWQQVGASVTRPGGPGAVLGVDEVMTALLAGCRGQVPLAALITLLADFHGVDADALAEAALPSVREAIGRGVLHVAE